MTPIAQVGDDVFAWLLDPWHFVAAYLAVVLAVALDLVALAVLARRAACATYARRNQVGALAVTAVLRTHAAPVRRAPATRPHPAAYRLLSAPCAPRAIPIAWTRPPAAASPTPSAPRTAVLDRPAPPAAREPLSARVVRHAPGPLQRLEPGEITRAAGDLVIAPAIGACRASAEDQA